MSDSDIPSSGPPVLPGPDAPASGFMVSVPSWQEQDPVLRDMWLQNKTPQEISDVLKRSVAAIMTRAARLGLPRRAAPGRKPGSRRSTLPGGQSVTRVSTPRTGTMPAESDMPAPQSGVRVCLMCLRKFQSQGRHNRICPSCKGSADYATATSLADIHFPV